MDFELGGLFARFRRNPKDELQAPPAAAPLWPATRDLAEGDREPATARAAETAVQDVADAVQGHSAAARETAEPGPEAGTMAAARPMRHVWPDEAASLLPEAEDRLPGTTPLPHNLAQIEDMPVEPADQRSDTPVPPHGHAEPSVPDRTDSQVDIAHEAERGGDWEGAYAAWARVIALGPSDERAHRGLVAALRALGRHEQADAAVEVAVAEHPRDARLVAEHADALERRGDYAAAAEQWRSAVALAPEEVGYRLREAACLRHAAEGHVQADHPAQEAEAVDGPEAAPAPPEPDMAPAPVQPEDLGFLHAFESLGGASKGAEFGDFLQQMGVNAAGLLRRADIGHDELRAALEAGFAGVGDAEHTAVFVPPDAEPPEYWSRDLRYGMAMRSSLAMRSSILASDMPLEEAVVRVGERLRALRTRLLDELARGEKIFVYKDTQRTAANDIVRLHAACQHAGPNVLLYIRHASEAHPAGSVVSAGPGLMIGHIDGVPSAANGSLLAVCRNAHAIWTGAATPVQIVLEEESLDGPEQAAAFDGSPPTMEAAAAGAISGATDQTPGVHRTRVGIFGTSNSIMRGSYSRRLAETDSLEVVNQSIGACPNVGALYSLTQARTETFDVVILDNTVADLESLDRDYYTLADVRTCFRSFMDEAVALWPRARFVVILVPRQEDLLGEHGHGRRLMDEYRGLAAEYGAEVVDLPLLLGKALADHPPLLHLLYRDHLHLSDWMSTMLARGLEALLATPAPEIGEVPHGTPGWQAAFLTPEASEAQRVARTSSLRAEEFLALADGERVCIRLPKPGRLLALVVNRYTSSAMLVVTSDGGGRVRKDVRLAQEMEDKFGSVCMPVRSSCRGTVFEFTVSADVPAGDLEGSYETYDGPAQGTLEFAGALFLLDGSATDPGLLVDMARPHGDGDPIRVALDDLEQFLHLAPPVGPDAAARLAVDTLGGTGELQTHLAVDHLHMAHILVTCGRFDDALVEGSLAARIAPGDVGVRRRVCDLHIEKAARLVENGAFAEAETNLVTAVRQDPTNPRARHMLSRALAGQHRPVEAMAAAMMAVQCQPGHAHLEGALAVTQMEAGEFHWAEASARRAIELEPEYDGFRTLLSTILDKKAADEHAYTSGLTL